MTNEELIEFVKRKARYSRKVNRQPWVEILTVLERDERRENSLAKQLRKMGISQNEVADKMNVAQCTVSLYLSGKRKPPEWFSEKLKEVVNFEMG